MSWSMLAISLTIMAPSGIAPFLSLQSQSITSGE